MGFSLNPFKNPLERGIKKLAGKSPVLNKLPGVKNSPSKTRAPGVGTATKSPIAPSPGVVNAGVAAGPDMSKTGATGGPAPTRMPPPQMRPSPIMQPPPMEAPEAVPGMADMAQMQAPPMQAPQPMPPPQMPQQMPQVDPRQMQMLQQRMGRNTGIAGRPSGIGPRFMGQ